MNLALDFGNTRIKWGIFDESTLACSGFFLSEPDQTFLEALDNLSIHKTMYLATRNGASEWMSQWLPGMDAVPLDDRIHIPLEINYQPPAALGKDRLAGAVGARFLFPGVPLLVIDMGTCITLDRLDEAGRFLGGNISPGIQMRLKALHTFTAKLPMEAAVLPADLLGCSTSDAIRNGAIRGTLLELEEWIRCFNVSQSNLQVILTGGDAHFFENYTNSKIFACSYLVLQGINELIRYNG